MAITKEQFEAAKADQAELDQIVEQFRESLKRFITTRLKSKCTRIEVDDVLQETILRTYTLFERVEWRGEKALFGWLCGISLHVIQEMQRRFLRINNETPVDAGCDESTPSRSVRRKERFERLEASLDGLSEDERRVIKLLRIEGQPLKQVARIMDRSERAVYQLLWRSMKKLKTAFGDTASFRLSDDRLTTDTVLRDEQQ